MDVKPVILKDLEFALKVCERYGPCDNCDYYSVCCTAFGNETPFEKMHAFTLFHRLMQEKYGNEFGYYDTDMISSHVRTGGNNNA